MSFWCLQFLLKNEPKQVNLRYHGSKLKVEFICSFFGRNVRLKKSFRLCLTFNDKTALDEKTYLGLRNIFLFLKLHIDKTLQLFWICCSFFTNDASFWRIYLQILNFESDFRKKPGSKDSVIRVDYWVVYFCFSPHYGQKFQISSTKLWGLLTF